MDWFTPKFLSDDTKKGWRIASLARRRIAQTVADAQCILPTDEFFPRPLFGGKQDLQICPPRLRLYGRRSRTLELKLFSTKTITAKVAMLEFAQGAGALTGSDSKIYYLV